MTCNFSQYCFIHHIPIHILCVYCCLSFYTLKEKKKVKERNQMPWYSQNISWLNKNSKEWKELERRFLPTGPLCLHFVGSHSCKLIHVCFWCPSTASLFPIFRSAHTQQMDLIYHSFWQAAAALLSWTSSYL